MKSKKVYIGIVAVTISIVLVIASIFYIKANNKDVELSEFEKNSTNENTKEAMQETNEVVNTENTNEESEVKENEQEVKEEQNNEVKESEQEVKKEEHKAQNKKEEQKVEPKKEEQKVQTKKEEPKKEIQVTPITKTMYVNASSLNVRSGPDTSYTKIGALAYAQQVNITGQSSNWYRISYSNKTGFVRGDYLSDSKPEPKVETKAPEQTQSQTTSVSSGNTVAHLIIINSRNNTLRYYTSGNLARSYSCATGTSGTPTPQGKFSVNEKIVNRPYYKQNIPGGAPNNPLGPRWLQFKSGGYAIHGTNVDSSIGKNASHGCVRMHNSDVIELYGMVPMGATVIVKNTSQSDKEIAAEYGIHIN